jgi:hypothetical protein
MIMKLLLLLLLLLLCFFLCIVVFYLQSLPLVFDFMLYVVCNYCAVSVIGLLAVGSAHK